MFCGAEMEDGWAGVHMGPLGYRRGYAYLGWEPADASKVRRRRWWQSRIRSATVLVEGATNFERLTALCRNCDAVVIHPLHPVEG